MGLFSYWELKQIPNFLLAAPILFLSFKAIYRYASHDWRRFFTFGTQTSTESTEKWEDNPLLLPYMYYWFVYSAVLLVLANVQIATRQLASLPALYWFSAQESKRNPFVVPFFLLYNVLGAILFSNFYPWT